MTEEQKQEVAVFRFGVIAEFVGATRLDFGEQTTLLKQKCARKWQIPSSGRTRLSRSTLLRWIGCYNASGGQLESLYFCGVKSLMLTDVGAPRSLGAGFPP